MLGLDAAGFGTLFDVPGFDVPGEIGNRLPGPAFMPIREAARAASSAKLADDPCCHSPVGGANDCELLRDVAGFGLIDGSGAVG